MWVQNAGLCCATLSPQSDPTVWLHFSFQLCSDWTVSWIMSGAASEGSRHSLKYVTTGGVWLSLLWFTSTLVSPYRFFFQGFKRNRKWFTALGRHFIIAHFETTLDTSEGNILHVDTTSSWFWWYIFDSCRETLPTWELVVKTKYPRLFSEFTLFVVIFLLWL